MHLSLRLSFPKKRYVNTQLMIPYAIIVLEASVNQPPTFNHSLNLANITPTIPGFTRDNTLLYSWTIFRKNYTSSYPNISVHRYARRCFATDS